MKPWGIMGIKEVHLEECRLRRDSHDGIAESLCSLSSAPLSLTFRIEAPACGEESVPLAHPAADDAPCPEVVHRPIPHVSGEIDAAIIPVLADEVEIGPDSLERCTDIPPDLRRELHIARASNLRGDIEPPSINAEWRSYELLHSGIRIPVY